MKWLVMLLELTLIPLLLVAKGLLMGLCLIPAAALVRWAWDFGWIWAVLSLGPAYFIFGLSLMLGVLIIKWGSFYRAIPGDFPFASVRAVRWAMTAQFHDMARMFILMHVRGTWIINLYFRLMGVKIGKRVIINTTAISDWDLISIGDDSMLGDDAVILGHAAEKGKLKMSHVRIGKGCTIGRDTALMPGVEVADGAVVAAMTVVTKGKKLEENSVWAGTELRMLKVKGGLEASVPG